MTPKSIHSFYKTLQNTLSPIKENNNTMKNLKSINEFGTNVSIVNEGTAPDADKALKDLKRKGSQIDWLDDADDNTKKIWKKAGVNPEDENTIILYSYANDSWPETKKILNKHNVDYKELEDPNADGESYIVFVKESTVNEEYVESMDSVEIGNALGKIETLWKAWKDGPMTEPNMIKPAQKELKGWLDRWFKQNIK